MKHDIDNMGFEKEPKQMFMVYRKVVEEIKDLELLGVYTYLMLIYHEGLPPPIETMAKRIAHKFGKSEKFILNLLRENFDLFDDVTLDK